MMYLCFCMQQNMLKLQRHCIKGKLTFQCSEYITLHISTSSTVLRPWT
uniref:Uncharacterized protein n=1 Tax=Anguilla anguilla TaxID=7936 RepID=A0A0E9WTA5_ANGAN